MEKSVIERVPGKVNGQPVFVGTRVPVAILFAVLQEGHDIAYFLEGYPTVSKEQVIGALEEAVGALLPDDPHYRARHEIIDDEDDTISEQDILEKLDSLRDDIGADLTALGRLITEGFEELKGKKNN